MVSWNMRMDVVIMPCNSRCDRSQREQWCVYIGSGGDKDVSRQIEEKHRVSTQKSYNIGTLCQVWDQIGIKISLLNI